MNGDSIAFVNLSGDKRRHEILAKKRYNDPWILNDQLVLLRKGDGQTAQYAYPLDLFGDGREGMPSVTLGGITAAANCRCTIVTCGTAPICPVCRMSGSLPEESVHRDAV
jgi:hypothetical protein